MTDMFVILAINAAVVGALVGTCLLAVWWEANGSRVKVEWGFEPAESEDDE